MQQSPHRIPKHKVCGKYRAPTWPFAAGFGRIFLSFFQLGHFGRVDAHGRPDFRLSFPHLVVEDLFHEQKGQISWNKSVQSID